MHNVRIRGNGNRRIPLDTDGKGLFIIGNGQKVAKYEAGKTAVTFGSCRP